MTSKKKKYAIGIDLGGTKIFTALLDRDCQIISTLKEKTKVEEGKGYFFKTIEECVKTVIDEAEIGWAEIVGLGIGCPGIINEKDGVVISSPNIPFLKNMPLRSELIQALGLDVVIENDVNTGLYGEQQFGAAVGYSNVVGIFIGTGIGGGFIFNKELYRGARGSAGEVGHMLIDPLGPLCGCGKRGCLEAMAGRLAIASEAATLAAKQHAPRLFEEVQTDLLKIKSGVLAKVIKAGDRSIEELVRRKARLVGIAMANIVNLVDPDLIVLGGGMVEALPEIIVKEATQSMREHAMSAMVKNVKVAKAKLKDFAIVMGAAKLVWDHS
jgi:glucokinase